MSNNYYNYNFPSFLPVFHLIFRKTSIVHSPDVQFQQIKTPYLFCYIPNLFSKILLLYKLILYLCIRVLIQENNESETIRQMGWWQDMEHNNKVITQELRQAVIDIKTAILQSQARAAKMISGSQLSLYYGVGLYVSANSREGKWGTGAIKSISDQLRRELPGLRGFSEESIKKMRTFAEFWSQYINRSPTATDMDCTNPKSLISHDSFSLAKWSPLATEINRDEFLGISFSHHMEILHKTKNIQEVLNCIHEAVVHQWDKYTLRDVLKAGIPQPEHAAPNNFAQTMPTAKAAMNTSPPAAAVMRSTGHTSPYGQ